MLIHSEPGHECRTFITCNWKDENGNYVMHERTYWKHLTPSNRTKIAPAALFHYALQPEPKTQFWLNVTYKDLNLAQQDAQQFGFVVEQEFYCDENDPAWFPIFNDFDKALAFLKAKTGIDYQPEPEKA